MVNQLISFMKELIRKLPLLVVILLGLVPILWYLGRGDVLINGVDTNFPLDPAIWFFRRVFVWNSVPNAGIDFSSSTAGLFFHLIQLIPYQLGFNLQPVQIISLVVWFLLIVVGAFLFAKTLFPASFALQILFVVFYSFNIYLFNTWENVKVANLSLVAASPYALTILQKLKENKISRKRAALYSVLVGVLVSGSGINPSYLISFILILVFFSLGLFLGNYKLLQQRLKDLLVVVVVVLLINAFWILPTGNYIYKNISASGSVDKIGFTNWIDSLSENTSILNVMRMQGAWDWYPVDSKTGNALYIPYATNYFSRAPFVFFSFLIPLLALCAFIFRKKEFKDIYISFGLMLLVGLFLGVGTHLPSGSYFTWLYYHFPFFTLFRSPWYIFTPLLIIAFAGLIALFVNYIQDLVGNSKLKYRSFIVPLIVAILIVGNLIYSYPLIQGKIFRPASQNSFFVSFPKYVFDSSLWLSSQDKGRIVGYPDDEIERFNWGYIGTESILGLISNQETLFSPLNAPNAAIAELIKNFYRSLKERRMDSLQALAAKLDIGILFEKKDQQSLSLPVPEEFKQFTSKTFGAWNFYDLPNGSNLSKIYTTNDLYLVYPYSKSAKVAEVLPPQTTLINPEDTMIKKNPPLLTSSSKVIYAKNSHLEEFNNYQLLPSLLSERLQSRDLSKVTFAFETIQNGSYQPILEKYSLEDFGIDLSKGLEIELDGKASVWKVTNISCSYVYFNTIDLAKGSHQAVIKLINNNLVFGGDFTQGFAFEKGEGDKGMTDYKIEDDGKQKVLGISNIGKRDSSAEFIVKPFDSLARYYLEIKYRQIYGNNASLTITQYNANTLFKAQVERMPNHPEWKLFSFYYEPINTDSDMKVSLNAPFTVDPLGTKVLYEDLKVFKLFSNDLFLVEKNSEKALTTPKISFKKISPILYEANIEDNIGPHVIVFSENYSPDWVISLQKKDGGKIDIDPDHFSVNSYANAWYVNTQDSSYKMQIWYKPQSFFIEGGVISIVTAFILLMLNIYNLKILRRK